MVKLQSLLAGQGFRRAVLVAYIALVFSVIASHEAWFDEAQAWLIARDVSYVGILGLAKYEGTPVLWHLLLSIPAKLGLPYYSMNLLGGLLGTIAVYILLFRLKGPIWVRAILPFTYFFAFQYSVVARNYCLLAPLLLWIAELYPKRIENPGKFAISLILLSHASVHGFLIVASICFITIIDLIKTRNFLRISEIKNNVIGLGAVALNAGLIALQMVPNSDTASPARGSHPFSNILFVGPDIYASTFGGDKYLAFIFFLGTCLWFYKNQVLLLYLIPTFALLTLFTMKYFNVWHEGCLFLTWVFVTLIAYYRHSLRGDNSLSQPTDRVYLFSKHVFSIVTGLIFIPFVYWSYCSIRFDWEYPYSGSKALVNFIKQNNIEQNKFVGIGFISHAILPYFEKNLYINSNDGGKPCFWFWSETFNHWEDDSRIAYEKPDFIVIGLKFSPGLEYRPIPGYTFVQGFPGAIVWKNRLLENDSFVLLKRISMSSKMEDSPSLYGSLAAWMKETGRLDRTWN